MDFDFSQPASSKFVHSSNSSATKTTAASTVPSASPSRNLPSDRSNNANNNNSDDTLNNKKTNSNDDDVKANQQQQQQHHHHHHHDSHATSSSSSSRKHHHGDNNNATASSASASAPVSSPAPTPMTNVFSMTGQYATFLHSSNLLGVSQSQAVPPPPPTTSSTSSSTTLSETNQEEDLENENETATASASAAASSRPRVDKNNNNNSNENAKQNISESISREVVSRENLKRQLEAFGISEALDPNFHGAFASGQGNNIDPLSKSTSQAEKITFMPKNLMYCTLTRSKGSLFDPNVYFSLYQEAGKHFLLAARKRAAKSTTNFLISGDENDLTRESQSFLGKVRGNATKTVYIVYDSGDRPENDETNGFDKSSADIEPLREELAYVIYQPNFGGSGGPRKMIVVLPKRSEEDGRPLRRYKPRVEEETMFQHWKQDPTQFLTLETKEPTWNEALRAYQLNFRGRVSMQSVKNFQLVDVTQPGRVVLQVGKRGDEDFVCDYQHPLNSFLAVSIALTAFDGSFVRE